MKSKRHIIIPALLFVYLGIVAFFSYENVQTGEVSMNEYILTIVGTLLIIVVLFFVLRRRDKLRQERLNDLNKNKQ